MAKEPANLAVLGSIGAGITAVAAFREALEENTRARVPLDWAMMQMNLALAYRALFDKDHQPRHLDDAREAVDGAQDFSRSTFHDIILSVATENHVDNGQCGNASILFNSENRLLFEFL